ncbi:MAG: hypothetical protein HY846_02050 [Nitrosomonadales bacterium]|nr:hypothetical protein [Nitrosomonadales bacterium]
MDQVIKQAIASKKLIEFLYSGHRRIAEPHVLGVFGDETAALCYQTGGGSNSGRIPEWRRFALSKMTDLKVRQEVFPGPRAYPSGKHSSWDYTIAIVS